MAVAATALALAGCGTAETAGGGGNDAGGEVSTVTVGSQDYYSNEIIAEIYAQALSNAGFDVETKLNIGQRDAYMPEVESGAINVFPEYTGSLLEYLSKDGVDVTSPDDVYAALQDVLPDSLTALDFAEASDQDTYTVLKSFAEENGLVEIGDLAKVTTPLTIGAAPEFEQRPYSPARAKEVYGVDLTFSATGETTLDSLLAGEIQVADIYSSDPEFATGKLVSLEDPKNIIISANVVPIASSDIAPEIADIINPISAKLTVDELVSLNAKSKNDQESSEKIATEWLKAQGLV